jgi:DNA-binding LytR/AlgR family response regulator
MSAGREIHIITTTGEHQFYGKLQAVSEQLPEHFWQIHKSYILNSDYVKTYGYESVVLTDGTVLSISKSYRKEIRHKLLGEAAK